MISPLLQLFINTQISSAVKVSPQLYIPIYIPENYFPENNVCVFFCVLEFYLKQLIID